MKPRIAALLTCHNRSGKTSACLRSLRNQVGFAIEEFHLSVFLVDDGCTDGTAAAALEIWPKATIITGDGKLFWCGGMRKAWEAASATDPDFYLLLNDDTALFSDAIRSLLAICPTPETTAIAVGAICDPHTGEWTYGGLQSDTPFIGNGDSPRLCRTMNANCALVPRAVFKTIGMFLHAYQHAMGDMDYGLLASKRGIRVLETPAFVGECKRNSAAGTWRDNSLPRFERMKKLLSHKGLPPRAWLFYCCRNCGHEWLRYFITPYLRVLSGH
jgi:GT2 family glycosyltransferase